jgi:hypothetical protein
MSLTDYLASRANKTLADTMTNFDIVSKALLKNDDRGIAKNVSALNVTRFHE